MQTVCIEIKVHRHLLLIRWIATEITAFLSPCFLSIMLLLALLSSFQKQCSGPRSHLSSINRAKRHRLLWVLLLPLKYFKSLFNFYFFLAESVDESDYSLSGFPPVEERSGPEGAEEDAPGTYPASSAGGDEDEDEEEEQYDTVPQTITSSQVLPWGAPKERSRFPSSFNIETDIRPGEFVMRTLFAEFTVQAEKKINAVMAEALDKPLSKSLQRGEDAQFDQVLSAFGEVAEHCLPSLLRTLFAWYDRQGVEWIISDYKGKGDSKGKRYSKKSLRKFSMF